MDSVRAALEEHADNLYKMSRYSQDGLKAETRSLASWSQIAKEYADDTRRAKICLEAITGNYHNAERLIYERLTDEDSTLEEESLIENAEEFIWDENEDSRVISDWWKNRHRRIDSGRHTGNYRRAYPEDPAIRWDNAPTDKIPWEELTDRPDWRALWPLINFTVSITGYSAEEVRNLILSMLPGTRDENDVRPEFIPDDGFSGEYNEKYNENDETPPQEMTTGIGESIIPKESLSTTESGVSAKRGGSCGGAVSEVIPEDLKDPLKDNKKKWWLKFISLTKNNPKEKKKLSPVDELLPLTEPDIEVYGPVQPEKPVAPIAPKSGGGAAAPLIGVASAASIAVSGVGISKKFRKEKGEAAGADEPGLPAVSAQKANGVFSGNLQGDYVILASLLSLLFSGASITACAFANRKKPKTNGKFKIGYGTSAVLSDGDDLKEGDQ